MHLDQDMASRLGESLRLLCGIRPVRMIPETSSLSGLNKRKTVELQTCLKNRQIN